MGGSVTRGGPRSVLCWVDAGPVFGLGHVSRALALAEALTARGVVCHFALPADVTALAWLAAAGMPSPILLPEREPVLPHVLAAAAAMDAVIVDVRHPLASDEVRALGGRCPVMVVDNAGDGVGEADLILAPLLATAPNSRWLIGPEHVPLRASFRTPPAAAERPPGEPPVVLVSMGATDPGGLTVPIVDALARVRASGTALTARVVANPTTPVWHQLPALLARHGLPAPHPVEPAGTAAHLAAADLAVLAMGVTVYEAMACGVPAIVLCRTSGDVAHARALSARGALESLGLYWTEERVAHAVARLVTMPARRAALSRAARTVVDGRGAERAATRLLGLLEGEGKAHAGEHLQA